MAKILFAWELGANLGHLARDLPVAECLRDQGHHVAFAVRNPATAAKLLFPRGFGFVQSPVLDAPNRLPVPPASYAEMLLAEGYGQLESLLGRVRAWCMLYDLCRPDMIVADHAPTALVAAKVAGIPSVAFGSGFEVPPQCSPWPSIRPWERIEEGRLVDAEGRILESVSRAASALGGKPLERLADLFADPVLVGFPELDHYGARDSGLYVGSLPSLESAPQVVWPEGQGPRIFAYLRPSVPGFTAALQALSQWNGIVVTAAPGISLQELRRFESARHRIIAGYARIDALLDTAQAVVCYGGAGLMAQSLLAGVPLLVLPETVEQWLGGKRVVELGAGRMIEHERQVETILGGLTGLLSEPELHERAQRFASKYAAADLPGAAEQASAAILRFVGTRSNKSTNQAHS